MSILSVSLVPGQSLHLKKQKGFFEVDGSLNIKVSLSEEKPFYLELKGGYYFPEENKGSRFLLTHDSFSAIMEISCDKSLNEIFSLTCSLIEEAVERELLPEV